LDAATQHSEIQGSKTFLETLLGHPIAQFAYPFGNHNNVTVGTTMLAGFQSGTVYGTLNTPTWPVRYNAGANSGTNPLILPRFPISLVVFSGWNLMVIIAASFDPASSAGIAYSVIIA